MALLLPIKKRRNLLSFPYAERFVKCEEKSQ